MTASLLRSRYLALGIVALLFGTAMLSVNFANEYVALNGETGLTDLPSFQSVLKRTGQLKGYTAFYAKWLAWPYFLKSQFYHIGGMSLPYTFTGRVTRHGDLDKKHGTPLGLQDVGGILVSGTCLTGLAFVRHKILWATLVLSGFCWGLPMRHSTAFHNFESLFYIGLPLFLFSLVLLFIHRLSGRRLSVMVSLSVAALPVFVLSSFQMARVGYDAAESQFQKDVMTDFDVIRKMTVGNVVVISGKLGFLMRYALTGTILLPVESSRFADFVISISHDRHHAAHDAALLTPDNRQVFLYRRDGYEKHIDHIIEETGAPLIHAEYRGHGVDVYRSDNRLYYVRSPRPKPPEDARFFLHVTPVDVNDLPDHRNFDNLDFYFDDKRVPHGTRDVAVRTLPDYDVARIRTGQYTSEGRLWKAEVSFEDQPDDD